MGPGHTLGCNLATLEGGGSHFRAKKSYPNMHRSYSKMGTHVDVVIVGTDKISTLSSSPKQMPIIQFRRTNEHWTPYGYLNFVCNCVNLNYKQIKTSTRVKNEYFAHFWRPLAKWYSRTPNAYNAYNTSNVFKHSHFWHKSGVKALLIRVINGRSQWEIWMENNDWIVELLIFNKQNIFSVAVFQCPNNRIMYCYSIVFVVVVSKQIVFGFGLFVINGMLAVLYIHYLFQFV